jgi:hypothetical protein
MERPDGPMKVLNLRTTTASMSGSKPRRYFLSVACSRSSARGGPKLRRRLGPLSISARHLSRGTLAAGHLGGPAAPF